MSESEPARKPLPVNLPPELKAEFREIEKKIDAYFQGGPGVPVAELRRAHQLIQMSTGRTIGQLQGTETWREIEALLQSSGGKPRSRNAKRRSAKSSADEPLLPGMS